MDFYKQLIIKVLQSSLSGRDSKILKILKSGEELTQAERRILEELINSII